MTLPAPFRVWGEGNARKVLALHCSLAHAGAWSGVARYLPGVELTAFDQPGHGKAADWDGETELQGLTTRLAVDFAERIGGGEPVDLLGHSFGGTVCLRVALERPDLVRSLTLVEPVLFAAARAAGSPSFAAFMTEHSKFEAEVRSGHFEAGARMFHGEWGNDTGFDDMPEAQRRYMVERIGMIVAQGPSLAADSGGLLRYMGLESLSVPVLLIDGAKSPPVIDGIMQELARRLPQSERLTVPGAGHMVAITHPEAVARAMAGHLDRA
ncbi:MAG: alpha/beta hydrolase [Cereibacter sphaeroides]|uniref:Alpha/beta hydrolase n=1 Tax=Cereibacter sphaeroides TaxID=1063 RepID=A0A2W5SNY5_CERSP|nr:MAG: alpha/beta hydrolase [Cereibacter sphaeroides]